MICPDDHWNMLKYARITDGDLRAFHAFSSPDMVLTCCDNMEELNLSKYGGVVVFILYQPQAAAMWVISRSNSGAAALATCGQPHVRDPLQLPRLGCTCGASPRNRKVEHLESIGVHIAYTYTILEIVVHLSEGCWQ